MGKYAGKLAPYLDKFTRKEAKILADLGIDASDALKYPHPANTLSMILFFKLINIHGNIANTTDPYGLIELWSDYPSYDGIESVELLAVTGRSILMKADGQVWKYACIKSLDRETTIASSLKRVRNTTHLLLPTSRPFLDRGKVITKYVDGYNLEKILDGEGSLSSDTCLHYGKEILEGLIEMRLANVYQHRDLRPANILIETRTNTPLIIDFANADLNYQLSKNGNRKYGGQHDLISLGQIIYKMVTGHHLLNDSLDETRGSEVKSMRDAAYQDAALLKEYLKKVDDTVSDSKIAYIIKKHLLAHPDDHASIRSLY